MPIRRKRENMEINSMVNAVTGNSNVAVATQVLKKAQDLAAQQAQALVQSLSSPPSLPGIGQTIDTVA